jgi:hypothetical protein
VFANIEKPLIAVARANGTAMEPRSTKSGRSECVAPDPRHSPPVGEGAVKPLMSV